MPTFKYSARDQGGKTVNGKMAADNETLIIAELRKRNLIILNISEERSMVSNASAPGTKSKKKVKSEDVVIFTRQFATMVDAASPSCRPWRLWKSKRLM